MRVVHLAAGRQFGGVERLLTVMARHPAGMDQRFVLCFEGRTARTLREAGASVEVIGGARVSRPWSIWGFRGRLKKALRKLGGDVVVVHGCWPLALAGGAVARMRLPVVFWAHEVMEGRHWLEKWAGRSRPDLVVAGSVAVKAGVGRVFGDVETVVLACAVEDRCVHGHGSDQHRTAPVIVMVARMDEIKGHEVLIEALSGIKHKSWTCWMVGGTQTPEQEEYLRRMVARVGMLGLTDRVTFLGQLEDVEEVLAKADIYCQPNVGPEAFGISFVEAMDTGLPVVTSGIGGAVEIVDESCGILTQAGDVAGVGEALGRLLDDEGMRKRMGRAGRTRARMLCDPDARMKELDGILRKVCGLEAKTEALSCSVAAGERQTA